MKNRLEASDLSELFKKWESDYPVDLWEIDNVLIWPLIKKNIYFALFRYNKNSNKRRKKSLYHRIKKKIGEYITAYFYSRSVKLKESFFLFCSSHEQRIVHEGKEYNRFLEPMMNYLETHNYNSYFLEYPNLQNINAYREDRILNIRKLLPLYTKTIDQSKYTGEIRRLYSFEVFMEEVYNSTGLKVEFFIRKILTNLQVILSYEKLFLAIIKKTKVKYVIGLVYYSNPVYGMNLAASKLGVTSVDLQHGGQGSTHPAYFFNTVPKQGYNLLPDIFWNWDKGSQLNILEWSKNTVHSSVLGGNSWMNYVVEKSNKEKSVNSLPVILFTLQPLDDIIPEYFLKVIEGTVDIMEWWLRFHPRMSDSEKSNLILRLKEKKILNKVIIDKATMDPLPLVLGYCNLHISKSSGSITEAAMMGKFSLIIDPIGIQYYKNIINRDLAEPCLGTDVNEIILDIKRNLKKETLDIDKLPDYKTTLQQFINV